MATEKIVTKGVSFPKRYRDLKEYAEARAEESGRTFSNWICWLIEEDRRKGVSSDRLDAAEAQMVHDALGRMPRASGAPAPGPVTYGPVPRKRPAKGGRSGGGGGGESGSGNVGKPC
jgi:hypothetical protein